MNPGVRFIRATGQVRYALSELDREFHLAIFQRARLATLEPILTRCALHVHRYTFGNGPVGVTPDNRTGLPSSADQHRAVRDALATRDAEVAVRHARSHRNHHRSPEQLKRVRSGQGAP
jgi:DNA-binding GntR family transcriptional regulator